MRFAIVDLHNLFHRARHAAAGDAEAQAALAVQIIFRSLRKLYRDFRIEHMVFAVDHGSWRSAIYPNYKSRRHASLSPREQAVRFVIDGAMRVRTAPDLRQFP